MQSQMIESRFPRLNLKLNVSMWINYPTSTCIYVHGSPEVDDIYGTSRLIHFQSSCPVFPRRHMDITQNQAT